MNPKTIGVLCLVGGVVLLVVDLGNAFPPRTGNYAIAGAILIAAAAIVSRPGSQGRGE